MIDSIRTRESVPERTPWSWLLSNPRLLWRLLVDTHTEWSNDKAQRMGAALAYYTIFSLAPLLLIATAIAGFFLGTQTAQQAVVAELQGFVGNQAARTVERAIAASFDPESGAAATAVAVILLLFGSTMAFAEMRDALNTIWEMKPRPGGTLWRFLRTRLFSLSIVLGIAFLLLLFVMLSTAISVVSKYWSAYLPLPPAALSTLDFAVSFGIITILFAMLFKILPSAKIRWRDVWIGAALTSLLFTIGKVLIGLYLGSGALASGYGAAASVVVVAAWTYYSAQIFYFGAEMTHVYTSRYGSLIQPEDDAERAPKDRTT
jgi:membrane protein